MTAYTRSGFNSEVDSVLTDGGKNTAAEVRQILSDLADSTVMPLSDTGTAIGDYIVLEDVGGNPGLPAVDGSQLTGIVTQGTFTPIVVGSTTPGTATYSAQTGDYVRVGNLVIFTTRVTYSGGTGTGQLRIRDLPFTASANAPCNVYAQNIAATASNTIGALVLSGTTDVGLYNYPVGGGTVATLAYDAAGDIIVSGVFLTT